MVSSDEFESDDEEEDRLFVRRPLQRKVPTFWSDSDHRVTFYSFWLSLDRFLRVAGVGAKVGDRPSCEIEVSFHFRCFLKLHFLAGASGIGSGGRNREKAKIETESPGARIEVRRSLLHLGAFEFSKRWFLFLGRQRRWNCRKPMPQRFNGAQSELVAARNAYDFFAGTARRWMPQDCPSDSDIFVDTHRYQMGKRRCGKNSNYCLGYSK